MLFRSRKPIRDIIKKNPGIGPAKAISLAAAIELGMRCRDEIPQEKPRITGSSSVYELMRGSMQMLNHEEFWIMLLSRSHQVLDSVCISKGGSAATVVDPKILYRKVLEFGDIVSAIVLLHNHPSGNMRPSPEDDRLTRQLKDGGALLDIRVLDHVIITPSGYFSYADEGKI